MYFECSLSTSFHGSSQVIDVIFSYLFADMNYVLASAKDDTVKLLDLRMNQVMSTCRLVLCRIVHLFQVSPFSQNNIINCYYSYCYYF